MVLILQEHDRKTIRYTKQTQCLRFSSSLQNNFIEISLRHGCSPVNLLHIFRATSPRNTSGSLLTSGIHSINSKFGISSSVIENYIYEAILYNLFNLCEVFLQLLSKLLMSYNSKKYM